MKITTEKAQYEGLFWFSKAKFIPQEEWKLRNFSRFLVGRKTTVIHRFVPNTMVSGWRFTHLRERAGILALTNGWRTWERQEKSQVFYLQHSPFWLSSLDLLRASSHGCLNIPIPLRFPARTWSHSHISHNASDRIKEVKPLEDPLRVEKVWPQSWHYQCLQYMILFCFARFSIKRCGFFFAPQ